MSARRLEKFLSTGVSDGNFTVAYAWNNDTIAQGAMRDGIQWGVVDTVLNPPYQLATQFLAAASMDVKALDRNSSVHVDAFTPEGKTRSLRQMRVNRPEYILRKPLDITSLEALLARTYSPAKTNAP